jgi:hypothetical protein
MSVQKFIKIIGCLLSAFALLTSCGGGGGGGGDGNMPSAQITVSDPEQANLFEASFINPDGSVGTREIPDNQLIVLFENHVSHQQALDTISKMSDDLSAYGLILAGQVPDLGLYQLEIDNGGTNPAHRLATLDAVIIRLEDYDTVESVSYNELMEARFAENDDDNSAITGLDRTPFSVIDYYQAIPAFDDIGHELDFNFVTVAVIDSGIDLETGQFDDIQGMAAFEFVLVGFPGARPRDTDSRRHGTAVAGIIAADNGDGVTNGIASRILEERLSLIVGRMTDRTGWNLTRAIATAQECINRGARIVNMSWGRHASGRNPRWLSRLQNNFSRLFDNNPDVLFVASASNDRFELDNNDAPAGLPADNLITVGGIQSDEFGQTYSASSTGPGVEIAAPAVQVPVCCGSGNTITYSNGNSMAAPIVSSIAALILSLDPEMTGADLKAFITDPHNTYPAPEEVGGIRPALIRTVGNAILQLTSTAGAVDDLLHNYAPAGEADPPAAVISKLVSQYEFTVSGPGHHRDHVVDIGETNPADLTSGASNSITTGGFQLWLTYDADLVKIDSVRGFRLGSYTIGGLGSSVGALLASRGTGGVYSGTSESGTLNFTECELTTRSVSIEGYDILSDPIEDSAAIEVRGVLEGLHTIGTFADGTTNVRFDTDGSFTFLFGLQNIDSFTAEYLETNCIGGYYYVP